MRVEIADGSDEPPVVQQPDPWASGGRGLMLVEALADRWGYEPLPHGKVVWFELDA